MNTVDVGGLRIAYEREGSGPPIVLLNGYVGDGPGTFRRQLDELSDRFTVVAWDMPGSGRSSDPPEAFRLPDFADCLAGFMGAIHVNRAHVLGLSFGGGLALELYRRHPGIIRTLILASAYAGWSGSLPADEVRFRLNQVLELADLSPDLFTEAVAPTMFTPSAPGELVDAFTASVSRFHPIGLRAMARAFAEADLRDVLPEIQVPTLLLYGDADVRAPLDVAHGLHAAIPGSKLVVLPGAGHIISVEAPERLNDEVRAFVLGVEGDPD
jgi:pimeloyl-ACP methyl ester carboxylesterase